jgi:YD repeat-containing protein
MHRGCDGYAGIAEVHDPLSVATAKVRLCGVTGRGEDMRTRLAALLLVVACVGSEIACGTSSGSGPTTPSGGTCRTFATSATEVSTAVSGLMVTGAFNSSTKQFTATVIYPNGKVCTTAVFSYLSIADFVDEVKVIPGLTLASTSTTTGGPACGSGSSTITNVYDSQRRLMQVIQGASTTTYTAWDSKGRPTMGSAPFGSISNVYDDTARTVTTTQGASVTTLTYDTNGILLVEVTKTGSIVGTTTWTIASTDKVCK